MPSDMQCPIDMKNSCCSLKLRGNFSVKFLYKVGPQSTCLFYVALKVNCIFNIVDCVLCMSTVQQYNGTGKWQKCSGTRKVTGGVTVYWITYEFKEGDAKNFATSPLLPSPYTTSVIHTHFTVNGRLNRNDTFHVTSCTCQR